MGRGTLITAFWRIAALFSLALLAGCGRRSALAPPPEKPQLWCWQGTLLRDRAGLEAAIANIERARDAGYTGIVFWDVSFTYLTSPAWPDPKGHYLRQAMDYAVARGLKVMAGSPPFGYSNDILNFNPNWAEGMLVSGARFQVDSTGKTLLLQNSFQGLRNPGFEEGPGGWLENNDRGTAIDTTVAHSGLASGTITDPPGNARFSQVIHVIPHRQYRVRLFVKSGGYTGPPVVLEAFDDTNKELLRFYKQVKLAPAQEWTELAATFNSQSSTTLQLYFGVWGGGRGTLWFDDIEVRETAFVYLLRRAGAPLRVYDPQNGAAFREGADFSDIHEPGVVTIPDGSSLRPGQIVAVDYYAAQPVDSDRLGVCLTDPAVAKWLDTNARKVLDVVPPETPMFLGYDEMRQMNSCDSCRKKGMTAGQLLAWHVKQSVARYRALRPNISFYVWNDMFDPYANAKNGYYLVEGTLAGSWLGVPSEVTVMNWNLQRLRESLRWFSGEDNRQPAAHRQIIAGYYDTHDGRAAAAKELEDARGIPGIDGLMYTTWENDYSQMKSFADSARLHWQEYRASTR